jgi:hypothetical protein
MLLARLPASMSILWSGSRSGRMLDGVASGWPSFPASGRITGYTEVSTSTVTTGQGTH